MHGSLLHFRAINLPGVDPPASICGGCKKRLKASPFMKIACSCNIHLSCIDNAYRENPTYGSYRPRFRCPSCGRDVYCGAFVQRMKLPHVIPSGDLAQYIEDCTADGVRPQNVLSSLSDDILGLRVNNFIVPQGWNEFVTLCRLVDPPFLLHIGNLYPLSRAPWVFKELKKWSAHVHGSNGQRTTPSFPWPPPQNMNVSVA